MDSGLCGDVHAHNHTILLGESKAFGFSKSTDCAIGLEMRKWAAMKRTIAKAAARRGHVFALTVQGAGTRSEAELAVLAAFCQRQPDSCKFHLNKGDSHKDAYIAGSMSGVQLGFEMALRAVEQQMAHLKLKRGLNGTPIASRNEV